MSERILSVGGNAASRPISDFRMGNEYGKKWYVNNLKSASGNGKSWDYPVITIAEAVALASAGDIINIWGDGTTANQYNEAVTSTLAGLRIWGAGSVPNQVIWSAPDTTAPCLTITGVVDNEVDNIRFRPPVANAGIYLTGGAKFTKISNNRFMGKTGSYYGIFTDGNCDDTHILDNEFMYLNTLTYGYAFYSDHSVQDISGLIIKGNKFHSNTHHVVGRMRQSYILDNVFAAYGLIAAGTMAAPSMCLDVSGAAAGANIVTRNTFGGAYTTALYVSGSNDCWFGNWCNVTTTTAPTGFSILVPA